MKFPVTLLLLTASMLLPAIVAVAQPAPPPEEIHCSLLPVRPQARAARVPLIVEGEVLESRGLRGARGRIYTVHRLRVYKLLKGQAPAELTLLTEGGSIGLDRQELTNTLQLRPGQQGVFFLEQSSFSVAAAGSAWSVYASQQGFVEYDLRTATAAEPFQAYPALGPALYARLTGGAVAVREVQPYPGLAVALRWQAATAVVVAARVEAPVVTGLAPLSIMAGTKSVLTIQGTGFGATRGNGQVEFRNADVGGAAYTALSEADYVSWSDTQIRVLVPSLSATRATAGTGPVRVTTNDQLLTISAATVTIVYAASNVLDSNTGQRDIASQLNQNGTGGYTYRFDPGFAANTAAGAAWQRALSSWRCQTGVNWTLGATRTTAGISEDGQNSVGFDTGTELPTGVLGRTTSYYRGCYRPDGTVSFYVQEIDTQFDDATDWQFGPARPTLSQVDFESVALHELGHAQQLSHLILPSAVMHYAIARGQVSRTLAAPSDIAGGRYVLRQRGFVLSACGGAAMLPAPLTSQQARYQSGTGAVVDWTTQNECFVSGFVVERTAADTTTGWQAVATVAAGAGPAYRYTDAQPRTGLSYYRLRVRRPDGSLDTAVPLAVTDDATVADGVQFYPNPLAPGEPLGLQYLAGTTAGSLTLRFFDAVGRYLGGTLVRYQPGLNVLPVTAPELRAGWYIVRWTDSNGGTGSARLVRVN